MGDSMGDLNATERLWWATYMGDLYWRLVWATLVSDLYGASCI